MPNRIIKESVCTSDTLDKLSWFEECLWYRLIVNCDDYGRFDARPAVVKARLFPLKERMTLKDVSDALTRLADMGCVVLYECDGHPYLYLPTWEVHQTIRAKKSKYPSPESGVKSSEIICKQMQADVPVIQSNTNPIQYSPSESARMKEPSHLLGEHGYVKLTDAEYVRLIADHGEVEVKRVIAYIDESAASTGNKNRWKDWNLVIRRAIRDGWGKKGGTSPPRALDYPQRKYSAEDLSHIGVSFKEDDP